MEFNDYLRIDPYNEYRLTYTKFKHSAEPFYFRIKSKILINEF